MAAGTKIRSLSRLLDASPGCLWVIGPTGRLVYLSAGVSLWLGIDVDSLLERRSVAGSPISDDPLDFVAASLSPPPGLIHVALRRCVFSHRQLMVAKSKRWMSGSSVWETVRIQRAKNLLQRIRRPVDL